MARVVRLIEKPDARVEAQHISDVTGDYTIGSDLLQIRTYRARDHEQNENAPQNIQLDREVAEQLRDILNRFLNQ